MPELPEVEVVCQGLQRELALPVKIESVQIFNPNLRAPVPRDLAVCAAGTRLHQLRRRAKYILFETEAGIILSHLGMTGRWRFAGSTDLVTHDHARLRLEGGCDLIFSDPRRFGLLDWLEPGAESERLRSLGPEPLDPSAFTANYLRRRLSSSRQAIKLSLMNQQVVVGIGNIYASEILFRAKIRPGRSAGGLIGRELEAIIEASRSVLSDAINAGGSSIRDYVGSDGVVGNFQKRFSVYGRQGQPCINSCGSTIFSQVMGGRSTYWCPRCQRR